MMERNDSGGHFLLTLAIAGSLAAFAALPAAGTSAEAISSNKMKPLELRIVATEFKFAPARITVPSGTPITLVLDNSAGETEHGIVVPAFDFRLDAKAGEIAQKTVVFAKPGEYAFTCDLPGHREAGMAGTLIVSDSLAAR